MTRRRMTSWYNPALLVQTGIRVAISTIFGQFADKREAMAATNAIADQPFDDSFDYSGRARGGGFWFDFAADTGDGWDSTFAVARLLAAPSVAPAGEDALPRGRLLILGGDQVYPTASREAYGDRLLEPFEEAARLAAEEEPWPDPKPDMYVLPGNHDWYDGLAAFFGLFCRRSIGGHGLTTDRPGRLISGWQTQQTRSYFALRLSTKWWLWGTDAQLGGYIDQPQVDFFRHVASSWMEDGSNLILCVGDPAWVYRDRAADGAKFSRHAYLESLADSGIRKHRLKLVLTGDSHHYARYEEGGRHYVTCGGGGAFLHPTHQLRDTRRHVKQGATAATAASPAEDRTFTIAARAKDGRPALYPDRATSFRLSLANLAFAVLNWRFTLMLFFLYLVFNWALDVNAHIYGNTTLAQVLLEANLSEAKVGSLGADAMKTTADYLMLVVASPGTVMLMVAAWGAYCYFADSSLRRWKRMLLGTAHWLVQTLVALFVTYSMTRWAAEHWWPVVAAAAPFGSEAVELAGQASHVGAVVFGTFLAAIGSATLFGLYLILCLNLLRLHGNEAFSSLRIADFKCFLRFRISGEVLTMHAIGLESVPATRRLRPGEPAPPLAPHVIETVTIG